MVPEPEPARKAVAIALDALKTGSPSGTITSGSPRVQINDTSRKPGQTLETYQILGQTGGERYRTFTVRLTLRHPDKVETVRYFVLGIDPLLVFRQDDMELISHWEHRMDDPATEVKTP